MSASFARTSGRRVLAEPLCVRQDPFTAAHSHATLNMQTETPQRSIPALRKRACLLATSLAMLGTAFAQPVPTTFTRITTGSIATDVGESWSAAWGDVNDDGFEDLFVARNLGQNDRLYLNNGDGTFTSILVGDAVNDATDSASGVWGDYDNDGYLDLAVTVNTFPTAQPSLLYHNEGDGTLVKVTSGSVATNVNLGMKGCSWGDYDNDGHIDLFIANDGYTASEQRKDFLYHNDGDGGFLRILSGPVVNDAGRGEQGVWGDYNNDGKLDLFVANIFDANNLLYRNDGDGGFTKVTTGAIVNDGGHSIGCVWGDYDNDGFLDLFVANASFGGNVRNFLYRNTGTGAFERVTSGTIATDTGLFLSCAWGDYDNDGFLDLFVGTLGATNALYRNNGDGTFGKVTAGSIVNDPGDSSGCAWADYDNDGFLDLFVANATEQRNFLYHNDGNSNQWLKIKCVGGPSNRAAIGAKIRVQAQNSTGALFWQMREISGGHGIGQNSLIAHFGLGNATNAQTVRIEWPSGIVQTLTKVAAKQLLTVSEPPLLQAALADGSVQLLLTDNIGSSTDVEASPDLTEWDSIGTVTHTARTMPFADPAAHNQPQRFYRAVRQ
jgi:enediyne biosynthesis protein E4